MYSQVLKSVLYLFSPGICWKLLHEPFGYFYDYELTPRLESPLSIVVRNSVPKDQFTLELRDFLRNFIGESSNSIFCKYEDFLEIGNFRQSMPHFRGVHVYTLHESINQSNIQLNRKASESFAKIHQMYCTKIRLRVDLV